MTVHIVDATNDGLGAVPWGNLVYAPGIRTLCDKPVRVWRDGVVVEELATIPIDSPTIRQKAKSPKVPPSFRTRPRNADGFNRDAKRDRKVCKPCLQLARMSPDEREAAQRQANFSRQERFKLLADKTKAKKAEERAVLLELIERARPDAMACYDGWLSEPPILLRRCGLDAFDHATEEDAAFLRLSGVNRTPPRECALSHGHIGQHRSLVEPAPDLDVVLELALRAYKLEHPGRGDRLWVFREHRRSKVERKDRSRRDVVCRFCDETLGGNQPLGVDYTNYTFYPSNWNNPSLAGVPNPRAPGIGSAWSDSIVNVRRHTVECALRWLAKIPLRNDGLPEASFVLAFDDDHAETEHAP